jgi:hypothetical protein
LPANGRKKLDPLTYDNRAGAPAGTRGRAAGLKKNKKKMMLFRRSDAKVHFLSGPIVTMPKPEPAS